METVYRTLPENDFLQLCQKISREPDPKRRAPLMEKLIELLSQEQAEIRAKIRARESYL